MALVHSAGFTLNAAQKHPSMYCVKCRQKRTPATLERVTMKNGKEAFKGKCPECGTGMYRIGGVSGTAPYFVKTPEKILEEMLELL